MKPNYFILLIFVISADISKSKQENSGEIYKMCNFIMISDDSFPSQKL